MMIADVNTNLSFEEYYPEFKIVKDMMKFAIICYYAKEHNPQICSRHIRKQDQYYLLYIRRNNFRDIFK